MNYLRSFISTFHKPNIIKNVNKPNKSNAGVNIPNKKVINQHLHVNNDENKNNFKNNVENDKTHEVNDSKANNMTDELATEDVTGENDSLNDNKIVNELTNVKIQCNKDLNENNSEIVINDSSEMEVLDNNAIDDLKDIHLNTTVEIGDIIMTNDIDEIATKYLNEFNEAKILSLNKSGETEINLMSTDDKTKGLQEFDEVLDKLTANSELTVKNVTLDEINDVLDLDEYDTYHFQEIKCVNSNNNVLTIDFNRDEVISISSDASEKNEAENDKTHSEIDGDDLKNDDDSKNGNSTKHGDKNREKNDEFEIDREKNSIAYGIYKNKDSINKNDVIVHKTDDKSHKNNDDTKSKVFETISINSSNENQSQEIDNISISDSTNDGYNSSDFEFITEDEAKREGFIINFDAERHLNANSGDENVDDDEEMVVDKSYMENYVVPAGEDYLKLFRGRNAALAFSEIRYLENKCVVQRAPMYVQYDGIGFDMKLAPQHDSEDDDNEEANETLKKIVNMYPENSRRMVRRRRF